MKNILPMNMPAKKLSPICHKELFEQGPSILYGERHYALAPLENHVGVCALLIFSRKFGLKLFKRLNLAKRNAWPEVSGLRHYVRPWMLSVKTPLSTPLRLKLFVKLFFTFKFKYQQNNWLDLGDWTIPLYNNPRDVVRQQSNSLKKQNEKREFRLQYKVKVFFT